MVSLRRNGMITPLMNCFFRCVSASLLICIHACAHDRVVDTATLRRNTHGAICAKLTHRRMLAGRVSSFAAMLAAVGIIVQLVDVKRNWCKMYQICQCWSNVAGILFAHLLHADACLIAATAAVVLFLLSLITFHL